MNKSEELSYALDFGEFHKLADNDTFAKDSLDMFNLLDMYKLSADRIANIINDDRQAPDFSIQLRDEAISNTVTVLTSVRNIMSNVCDFCNGRTSILDYGLMKKINDSNRQALLVTAEQWTKDERNNRKSAEASAASAVIKDAINLGWCVQITYLFFNVLRDTAGLQYFYLSDERATKLDRFVNRAQVWTFDTLLDVLAFTRSLSDLQPRLGCIAMR